MSMASRKRREGGRLDLVTRSKRPRASSAMYILGPTHVDLQVTESFRQETARSERH